MITDKVLAGIFYTFAAMSTGAFIGFVLLMVFHLNIFHAIFTCVGLYFLSSVLSILMLNKSTANKSEHDEHEDITEK